MYFIRHKIKTKLLVSLIKTKVSKIVVKYLQIKNNNINE